MLYSYTKSQTLKQTQSQKSKVLQPTQTRRNGVRQTIERSKAE